MLKIDKETKILLLMSDSGGCTGYRTYGPARYLQACGFTNILPVDRVSDAQFEDSQICICQRQLNSRLIDKLEILKSQGKIIISEIDDLLGNIPHLNPASQAIQPEDVINFNRLLSFSHGITTTTPYLKSYYSRLNKSIEIVPNFIDFDLRKWLIPKFTKSENEPLRIVWSGSSSHLYDLDILGHWLELIFKYFPKVIYVHYADIKFLKLLQQKFNIDPNRCEYIPTTEFAKFNQNLTNAGDIGLCPLKNHQFNLAKSNLKMLEYGAAGIVPLSSNMPEYKKLHQQHSYGYCVESDNNLLWYINDYIQKPDKLAHDKEIIYQNIINNYDLKNNVGRWIHAWQNIIDNKCEPATPLTNLRNKPCLCGSEVKTKYCCPEYMGQIDETNREYHKFEYQDIFNIEREMEGKSDGKCGDLLQELKQIR